MKFIKLNATTVALFNIQSYLYLTLVRYATWVTNWYCQQHLTVFRCSVCISHCWRLLLSYISIYQATCLPSWVSCLKLLCHIEDGLLFYPVDNSWAVIREKCIRTVLCHIAYSCTTYSWTWACWFSFCLDLAFTPSLAISLNDWNGLAHHCSCSRALT